MTTLKIDVGTNACTGGCEHCRFGTQKKNEAATPFSDETLRVLEQVLLYTITEGQQCRVSYTGALLSLPGIPFLDMTDILSVSIESVDDLLYKQSEILNRLSGFAGKELELHLNHTLFENESCPEFFAAALAFFVEVRIQSPQVRSVCVGIGHNTVTSPPEQLKQECLVAGHAFIKYIESHLNRQGSFGSSELVQRNAGDILHQCATVLIGKTQFSFNTRYIQKPDLATINLVSPFVFNMEELSLFVNDRGVHVAHYAFAINQQELWFTHAEFEAMIAKAIDENVPLLAVCKEAVKRRKG